MATGAGIWSAFFVAVFILTLCSEVDSASISTKWKSSTSTSLSQSEITSAPSVGTGIGLTVEEIQSLKSKLFSAGEKINVKTFDGLEKGMEKIAKKIEAVSHRMENISGFESRTKDKEDCVKDIKLLGDLLKYMWELRSYFVLPN